MSTHLIDRFYLSSPDITQSKFHKNLGSLKNQKKIEYEIHMS